MVLPLRVVMVAAFLSACARARYACETPSVLAINVDSINASTAPLRVHADSTVSPDSIVGVVLRFGARSPVDMAQVRFRSDTTLMAYTDSAGRFTLPAPAAKQTILETRRVGYIQRRDTLWIAAARHQRLEVTLLDAWAVGDMATVVCVPITRP